MYTDMSGVLNISFSIRTCLFYRIAFTNEKYSILCSVSEEGAAEGIKVLSVLGYTVDTTATLLVDLCSPLCIVLVMV
jgi:hypothetical protein